jgi:excisionase family DNA binding protein
MQQETVEAVTVKEAAQRLSISQRTLARLISRREIASVRIGRCRRIRQEALREYLKAVETIRR